MSAALASGGAKQGSKAIILFGLLLVMSLASMIGLFGYVANKTGHDKVYIATAAEQQLLSQQMATFALQAATGKDEAFIELARNRDKFDLRLSTLLNGDATLNLPASPKDMAAELQTIEKSWSAYSAHIKVILDGRQSVETVSNYVALINEYIPQLLATSDEVVTVMIKKGVSPDQVYIASRQLMLTQRLENNLNRILSGGEWAATAADRFGRDAALFGRVLEGMLKGYPKLKIKRVHDEAIRDKLREVAMLFSSVNESVGVILENSPLLFEVTGAASSVETLAPSILADLKALEKRYTHRSDSYKIYSYASYGLGIVALIILVLLGMSLVKDANRKQAISAEQNNRNQRAILRLLDEMASLADGDLSVHTTVSEDITGAIADSVNYAIDALRELVTTINKTAVRVSASAEASQASSLRLADKSKEQASEITGASRAVADMAARVGDVKTSAIQSVASVAQSVDIAHQGAEAVRANIEGMDTIREQIQETSKRIKRLGESSQEIGDIVGLITEIADQTNILALNAAIQASMAGEAGRGFAVVADEVQRLAERASNATKQIEVLVKTIQADTNEAVISMEQSTANVVRGAELAEAAGDSLTAIEKVSGELSTHIQDMSTSSAEQAEAALEISTNMNMIQEITIQTSEDATEAAHSIGKLTDLSNELRTSVTGFKLPHEQHDETVVLENS